MHETNDTDVEVDDLPTRLPDAKTFPQFFTNISDPKTNQAIRNAERAYELGTQCSRSLGAGLVGNPAWMILLDLFLSTVAAKRLSVTSVCIGSQAPSATALRHITRLCKADLIMRQPDEKDRRRHYVTLTATGWQCVLELLTRHDPEL